MSDLQSSLFNPCLILIFKAYNYKNNLNLPFFLSFRLVKKKSDKLQLSIIRNKYQLKWALHLLLFLHQKVIKYGAFYALVLIFVFYTMFTLGVDDSKHIINIIIFNKFIIK